MTQRNIILNTDSYKASHYLQYPPNTTYVSSYIESRGGLFSETLFFGLQMFLKEYLSRPISVADIDEAEAILAAHGEPFNREGWEYILQRYNGFLPVAIEAVPEGLLLPTRNVLVQIMNTDAHCYWLTSYLETALLRAVWYPTTVATVSFNAKKIIRKYLHETADSMDGLPLKLQEFGARGSSSEETAGLGGVSHLVNFTGTDTISGLLAARRYYNEPMAGYSLLAAEHSTITSWRREGERDAYANMIERFAKPGARVAVVSDSYDLWNAIDRFWGRDLKEAVESSGGTLLIRPDSGDPVQVVCETVKRLMGKFGHRTNSKGYSLLPDCVRVMQGDAISLETIEAILAALKQRGMSADNVTFGVGAELLQKVNRDTQKFALKASAVRVDSFWRDVFKDPITDPEKRSKQGRLALVHDAREGFKTVREENLGSRDNWLQPVYRNGQLQKTWTFAEIRERANQALGDL